MISLEMNGQASAVPVIQSFTLPLKALTLCSLVCTLTQINVSEDTDDLRLRVSRVR